MQPSTVSIDKSSSGPFSCARFPLLEEFSRSRAPQLNFVAPCGIILGGYALLLAQAFFIATFMMRDRRHRCVSITA